jgi:hypothetical protein
MWFHRRVPDFDAIAADLSTDPDVEHGTGFGQQPGLRVKGKIFAMVHDDELVVKLPPDRCKELARAGGAKPFEIGMRRMREWVSVEPDAGHDWPALAREALAFVRP